MPVTAPLALLALLPLISATAARAADAPATAPAGVGQAITWQWPGPGATMVPATQPAGEDGIKVVGGAAAGAHPVLRLENPAVTSPRYAIEGRVRYAGIRRVGYLEMWSYFPDGGAYFTRTLAPPGSGPMAQLTGDSDWRTFSLPFTSRPRYLPRTLEVNVVLPGGGGTVWLGPAKLVQAPPTTGPAPAVAPIAPPQPAPTSASGSSAAPAPAPPEIPGAPRRSTAWWDDRTGGLLGGVLGTALGLYGATVGILVSRGRARAFVVALTLAVSLTCVAMLAAGLTALLLGQPYAVWYVLVLSGAIGSLVVPAMLPTIRHRYEQVELRRMSVLDAGA
jgi:hypothetical protein